jgi:hypothetical protein
MTFATQSSRGEEVGCETSVGQREGFQIPFGKQRDSIIYFYIIEDSRVPGSK